MLDLSLKGAYSQHFDFKDKTFHQTFSESINLTCSIKRSSAQNISNWSDEVLASQDLERLETLFDIGDIPETHHKVNTFHEISAKVQSNSCKIFKKFAGQWMDGCGFLDGEKLLCMDSLYHAILNETCLVYSFGLSDDWDFEIMLAKMGKFRSVKKVLNIQILLSN